MKPQYTILYDKSGKKRATICKIYVEEYDSYCCGMTFCSDDDKWNDKTGERIAYSRAMRAYNVRKPCIARTYRIYKYILNLKSASLNKLMKLTSYQIRYFPKGFWL